MTLPESQLKVLRLLRRAGAEGLTTRELLANGCGRFDRSIAAVQRMGVRVSRTRLGPNEHRYMLTRDLPTRPRSRPLGQHLPPGLRAQTSGVEEGSGTSLPGVSSDSPAALLGAGPQDTNMCARAGVAALTELGGGSGPKLFEPDPNAQVEGPTPHYLYDEGAP